MSKNITTSFRTFEATINEGDRMALVGWWRAAEECHALKLSASAYAEAAAADPKVTYTAGAIRVQVGHCLAFVSGALVGSADGALYKLSDFDSMAQLIDEKKRAAATDKASKRGGSKKMSETDKAKAAVVANIHKLSTKDAKALVQQLARELGVIYG